MLLESDILRLFFTGPYLVSSPLCSGVWCWLPLRGSTPTSLFASLLSSLHCPPWSPAATAFSPVQPPTLSWVASSTLIRVPLPLPDTARFHVQESFVRFRAKTDSSALAAYPHSATHQLYGHLPPITKTIQVRRTRHGGHCWRSKDELISDILLWTPTYGRAKAGRPAQTYIQQLCEDTGCNPEDLSEAMNDREKWRERVKDIRAGGTTWWWYYLCFKCKKTITVISICSWTV